MAIEKTYRDTAVIIRADNSVVTTWEEVWTDMETGQFVIVSTGEREVKPPAEGKAEMDKAIASVSATKK
tara:strand:+ start:1196 stop:1402 length:207 start_codon:yes stop_codon:yes gene_type:complete